MMMYLIHFIDEEYDYTFFTNIPYYVLYSITLVLVILLYLSDPGVMEKRDRAENEIKQLNKEEDSDVRLNKSTDSKLQLLVK